MTLPERLAKMEGHSREVDLALAKALVPDVVCLRYNDDTETNEEFTHWEYTGRTDDAIALIRRVLPGWACGFDAGPKTNIAFVDPRDHADRFLGARHTAEAATPAISLCLAALQALEADRP